MGATKKVLYRIFSLHLFTLFKRLLAPLSKVQCPNILDFRNPWHKVIKISGFRYKIKLLLKKSVKSPHIFFCCDFFPTSRIFLVLALLYVSRLRDFFTRLRNIILFYISFRFRAVFYDT